MKLNKIAALVAIAAASGSAFATDGYFAHGYGMKAKGMGGAATAMASDAMGGANNPASMVWAGDRLDIGLDLFSPKRKISRSGSAAGINTGGDVESGSNLHYVPEFGYNKMLGWDMSMGVTVYGNGGMNTDFPGGQIAAGTCNALGFGTAGVANALCGNGQMGIDLMQVIIAPTFAMKINKQHSLGVSLLLGHQQFKAQGIQSFAGFTPGGAGTNLSNLGRDKSNGVGLRFGWMGQLSDQVSMGAAYSPKMKMSKFDLYKDLFADQGGFDIPENWNIGIAFAPNDQWKIAADYQRINYGSVNSVGNSSRTAADALGGGGVPNSLGCSTCRGFGWDSIDVIKLGFEYKYNKDLTLRAGYNHSDNPIKSRDVTFNMLAPGVIQDHVTLGFTYNVSKDSELTMAYMHGFKNSVSGTSLFEAWLGGASVDKIEMYQNSLGIAYGLKF